MTVGTDATSAPAAVAVPDEAHPTPSRRSVAVEWAAVLLSPLLAVWPLRAQLWAATDWIDPYLHTALIQHGRDLVDRFGTNNRQFARAGFTVPGRLFNLVFGDLGGYPAFRYLLAIISVVPAYLLFRRLYGRAAGAVAVASVLACPVVLLAWGTDYGDSAAVGYLIAGTASLVMPAASPRRRLGWVALGGVALSLALHSMFVALPLVAAVVLAHAAVTARRDWRAALVHLGVLAAALVVTTGGLVLLSKLLFGHGDIIDPTVVAYRRLRMPDQIAKWHSPSNQWALADPYLLVPPAVLAGWAAVRLRRGVPPAELTVALATLLQCLAYGYLQFLNTEQTLEFYLYLSMLWPTVVLLSGFLVVAVARRLLDSGWTAWVPATLVLLTPLAVHPFRARLTFRIPWEGLVLMAAVVVVAAVAGLAGLTGRRMPRAGAVVLCAALVVGSYVLLTGKDTGATWLPGQIHYPPPRYAAVVATPYGQQRDEYAVASQLHDVVPTPARPGTRLLLWWPKAPFSQVINITAAQYGWNANALRGSLPMATPPDHRLIQRVRPDYVVLLAPTDRQFATAVRVLDCGGVSPSVIRTATLRHGSATVAVQVLRIELRASGAACTRR